MKILILMGKFGMGHWSASLALREQLLGSFSDGDVEIEDFFAYAMPGASEAVYRAFSLLVTYGGGLYNTVYRRTADAGADRVPVYALPLQEKLEQLLARRQPDAVIATHPVCVQLTARFKERTGRPLPLIACVTDLTAHSEWLSDQCDRYLVGCPALVEQLVRKGVAREKLLVTGIPVGAAFHRAGPRDGGGPRRLLVMGGGLGLMPRSDSFYQGLNALSGVETTVLTGRNEKLYHRIAGQYPHIQAVGFTDQVPRYMAGADLLLSKPGGITLFEAVFSGVPMLAWEPFLQQERLNARFLLQAGIGRVAPKGSEDCLWAIREMIYDDAALEAMGARMAALRAQLEVRGAARAVAALTGAGART
jgi:UDP-N-acetylglucosamine:LPS N-acetylglucosamine transferase